MRLIQLLEQIDEENEPVWLIFYDTSGTYYTIDYMIEHLAGEDDGSDFQYNSYGDITADGEVRWMGYGDADGYLLNIARNERGLRRDELTADILRDMAADVRGLNITEGYAAYLRGE